MAVADKFNNPSAWRAADARPTGGAESYPGGGRPANTPSEPRWQSALADALARERTVSGLVGTLLEQALRLTRARGGVVLLREARTGSLRLAAERGDGRRLLDGRELLAADAPHPLAEVARSGVTLIADWRRLHERWPSPGDTDRYGGVGSLVALPLLVDAEVIAVVALMFAAEVEPAPPLSARLEALATIGANLLDRAQLAEGARAAAEAKSAFLAMMSHELRTPLNAIMGYTSLLADEVVGTLNETQRDQLGRVQDQARHLLTLIEELLSLTRAQGGSSELNFERVEPVALVESVLPIVAPTAARKGLELHWRPAGHPSPFLTDADQVRQILTHLLTNAIKFTRAGTVSVELRESADGDESAVEFSVSDTGPGIPPADQDRIFEPFWQASRSHAHRAPGTGLGLHVARRMARLLGGDITVESRLGEGSSFTLRLPAHEE